MITDDVTSENIDAQFCSDFLNDQFRKIIARAEAAEARVKELEAIITKKDEALGVGSSYFYFNSNGRRMLDAKQLTPDAIRVRVEAEQAVIQAARGQSPGWRDLLRDAVAELEKLEGK